MHVIDISDPKNPEVVAFVDTPCGSHTETLVPDLANNRLLVYSNSSANTTFGSPAPGSEPLNCRGIDIVQVPLANPASASYLRFEPSGDPAEPVDMHHACHDTGVILGSAMKVACSGGTGMTIFSLDPADGGSLDGPDVHAPHRDARRASRSATRLRSRMTASTRSSGTSPAAAVLRAARSPVRRSPERGPRP